MPAISSTAERNEPSFAFDGLVKPLIFLTNCKEAARTSSSVTGGSKLKRVLIFLHIRVDLDVSELKTVVKYCLFGSIMPVTFVVRHQRLFSSQRFRIPAKNRFLSFCINWTSAGLPVSSCVAAHKTISVRTGARSIPFGVSR